MNSLLSLVLDGKLQGELAADFHGGWERRKQTRYKHSTTPQRQLAQIVLEYYRNEESSQNGSEQTANFHVIQDISNFNWEKHIDRDIASPRDLVVLVLPGQKGIHRDKDDQLPNTILVPTAAEFEESTIEPIYEGLGRSRERPPQYPQRDLTWAELGEPYVDEMDVDQGDEVEEDVERARELYWNWYKDNFDPKGTIEAIEAAAEKNGSIRWIDYRLPIDDSGRTLHLHLNGRERYDTGTFAYNFVKRGFKHGLIIVGTLKSEPDIDVLAVFER